MDVRGASVERSSSAMAWPREREPSSVSGDAERLRYSHEDMAVLGGLLTDRNRTVGGGYSLDWRTVIGRGSVPINW